MARRSRSQTCSLAETILAISAFVCYVIGSARCNFLKFTDTSGTSDPVSLQFGRKLFCKSWSLVSSTDGTFVFQSCHEYPDYVEIDSSWKAARAFSVLTLIFVIIEFVASIISACARNPDKYSTGWLPPVYLLTAIFQGLTLLLLNSNACKNNILVQEMEQDTLKDITFPETCSLGQGAKLSISAMSLWVAAAVTAFMAHKAEKEEFAEEVDAGLREPLTA